MTKIILFLLFVCVNSLFGAEPTMGILQSVNSNTKQIFSINNDSYRCEAYGVVDFDKLLKSQSINDACKEKIKKFQRQNPQAAFYSEQKLFVFMTYHLEFVKEKCLLFASGEITLSELLLKKGYGVLEPAFKDEEFARVYQNAQRVARFEKRGIWSEATMEECLVAFLKEE